MQIKIQFLILIIPATLAVAWLGIVGDKHYRKTKQNFALFFNSTITGLATFLMIYFTILFLGGKL